MLILDVKIVYNLDMAAAGVDFNSVVAKICGLFSSSLGPQYQDKLFLNGVEFFIEKKEGDAWIPFGTSKGSEVVVALHAFKELVAGIEATRTWQFHTFRLVCKTPDPDAQPMQLLSAQIQSEEQQMTHKEARLLASPEGAGVSESKES